MASEYASFQDTPKDESKGKKSKKAEANSDDDSEDSIDEIRQYLKKNRAKPAARNSKTKDALFRLKYWRIVLGTLHAHRLVM